MQLTDRSFSCHNDVTAFVLGPRAGVTSCVSCGYPMQSRPGASHYRLESCFLIAGHRCQLPDSTVMGSRVIIIKYTGPTSWKLLQPSNSCFFTPQKPKSTPIPFCRTSLRHSANPCLSSSLLFIERPEVTVLQMYSCRHTQLLLLNVPST